MDAMTAHAATDRYPDFRSLAAGEREGHDYRIRIVQRPRSSVAVIAPHGGSIERRTSAIATAIAGSDFNLYLFEGLDEAGSFDVLHITSHRFDEPRCLVLIGECRSVIAVHGFSGDEDQLFIGGRDRKLVAALAAGLSDLRLDVFSNTHPFPGTHPLNICNRGARGCGVQLELSDSIRGGRLETEIVKRVRSVLFAQCVPNAR